MMMHLDRNGGRKSSRNPTRGWEEAASFRSFATLDADVLSRQDSSVLPQRPRDSLLSASGATSQLGTDDLYEAVKREACFKPAGSTHHTPISASLFQPQRKQTLLIGHEHEVLLGQLRRAIDMEDNTTLAPALLAEARPASNPHRACSYLRNATRTRPILFPGGERNGTSANPGDDGEMRVLAVFVTEVKTKMQSKRKVVNALPHGHTEKKACRKSLSFRTRRLNR